MKDFGQWFNGQGKNETEEVDDVVLFTCHGCGKSEYLSIAEYESGDTGWYTGDDFHPGDRVTGVCGGGPWCTP